MNAQDEGKEFHYTWVIILLGMILCKPPLGFEIDMKYSSSFLSQFVHLQHSKNVEAHVMITKSFCQCYIQFFVSSFEIFHILTHIFDKYGDYIHFKCNIHDVLISPWTTIGNPRLSYPYSLWKWILWMEFPTGWPTTILHSWRSNMSYR
jgi:hypothetical protein